MFAVYLLKCIIVISLLVDSATFVTIAPTKTSSSIRLTTFSIPKPSSSTHAVAVIQKKTSITTSTALNVETPGSDAIANIFPSFASTVVLVASLLKITSDLKADQKNDFKDLKSDNKEFKESMEKSFAGLKSDNKEFKESMEKSFAGINNTTEKSITDLKAQIKDMIEKGNHATEKSFIGLKSEMEKGNNATEKSITELKAEFKDSINGLKNEMIELRGYLFWGKKSNETKQNE